MNGPLLSQDAVTSSDPLPAIANGFATASAEMLGAILDQSQDCIKVIGPTGRLDYMNRNGRCAMEIDDFAVVAGRNWWDLWPEDSQHLILDAIAKAREGQNSRFEAFCPTAKGTPRWWEVSVSPLFDAAGNLQGIVSVSRDITARVDAFELRRMAADEMRHRLQNAYTLTGAIITASARGSAEREEFAAELLNRLERLGIAQSLLLDGGDLGAVALRALLQQLTAPFSSDDCALDFNNVPDIVVGETAVRLLALVIGEFSTNSSKYGALRSGGRIVIDSSIAGGQLHLLWSERIHPGARPTAAAGTGHGNGHRLIERSLRAQGGALRIDWLDGGMDAKLSLPHATSM